MHVLFTSVCFLTVFNMFRRNIEFLRCPRAGLAHENQLIETIDTRPFFLADWPHQGPGQVGSNLAVCRAHACSISHGSRMDPNFGLGSRAADQGLSGQVGLNPKKKNFKNGSRQRYLQAEVKSSGRATLFCGDTLATAVLQRGPCTRRCSFRSTGLVQHPGLLPNVET